MMFDDLFGGNGYSLITDKDGNVITYDRVYSEQEQEVFSGNIFDYLIIVRSGQLQSRTLRQILRLEKREFVNSAFLPGESPFIILPIPLLG